MRCQGSARAFARGKLVFSEKLTAALFPMFFCLYNTSTASGTGVGCGPAVRRGARIRLERLISNPVSIDLEYWRVAL